MYHSYQKKWNLRFAQGELEVMVLDMSLEMLIWIIQEKQFAEKFGKTFEIHLQRIDFNPFQPCVALYVKTLLRKSNDWFLYEMQHWDWNRLNNVCMYFQRNSKKPLNNVFQ